MTGSVDRPDQNRGERSMKSPGLDLVRRTLDEARAAARARGQDAGRAINSRLPESTSISPSASWISRSQRRYAVPTERASRWKR